MSERQVWTWCAIDIIGIPAGLAADAVAETICHLCATAVRLATDEHQGALTVERPADCRAQDSKRSLPPEQNGFSHGASRDPFLKLGREFTSRRLLDPISRFSDETRFAEDAMTSTIEAPAACDAAIDPRALEAFMQHAGMHATAAVNALLVGLGDRLSLWKALAQGRQTTAAELAASTGLAQRYLEEWLTAQAANGYLSFDADYTTFRLAPEAAMVLADENSPALVIAAFQGMTALARLLPSLEQVFRTGDGIGWDDHDTEFFEVQERFSRPVQRQFLIDAWLGSVPGLIETLTEGASVADVGGYGTSTLLLARAFPRSRFKGFDFHDVSIAHARRAARAGLSEYVEFEIVDARSFSGGGYDAVLFIDCLHDTAIRWRRRGTHQCAENRWCSRGVGSGGG
jgi:hypothetical protein